MLKIMRKIIWEGFCKGLLLEGIFNGVADGFSDGWRLTDKPVDFASQKEWDKKSRFKKCTYTLQKNWAKKTGCGKIFYGVFGSIGFILGSIFSIAWWAP